MTYSVWFRSPLTTAQKSRGVSIAQNVATRTFGSAPIGQRPRQDGARLVILGIVCYDCCSSLSLVQILKKAIGVQDCCQYHQAKDGDGWVEYKGSLVFNRPQKVLIFRVISLC